MKIVTIIITLFLVSITACGQKGDLIRPLPPEQTITDKN
jgi:predicted small lipoprotein YifL